MPAGGFERFAGLFPVVRDQGGVFFELVGRKRLGRVCDCGVDSVSTCCKLRVVGDLLGQRMLEGVFWLRVQGLLEDELRGAVGN